MYLVITEPRRQAAGRHHPQILLIKPQHPSSDEWWSCPSFSLVFCIFPCNVQLCLTTSFTNADSFSCSDCLNLKASVWLALMPTVVVFYRCQVSVAKTRPHFWLQLVKGRERVKSNQTASHSVVVTLASLPDSSTAGKQPLASSAVPSSLSPGVLSSLEPRHLACVFRSFPRRIAHLPVCPSSCSAT